jgi:hypothetical protein
LVSHHRPGFYFRVLTEGAVAAGQEIIKLASGPEAMTVAETDALLYLPGHPRQQLLRALRIPALSPGTVRTLSELQGRGPLVLTLARGNYCPKEHQQHLELAANYAKVAVAYTQIATITTDDHHTMQEFRASVGAQWTFLPDPGRATHLPGPAAGPCRPAAAVPGRAARRLRSGRPPSSDT